ncbi:MAG: hypothetical protein RL015_1890, partial [Verrucomicrobiota bacterium]
MEPVKRSRPHGFGWPAGAPDRLRADVSHTTTKDDAGNDVSVMHACGHNMLMTCWVGTAQALAASKEKWKSTLVFIGQSAEERGMGALAMIEDGLYKRFPKPDVCLVLHCNVGLVVGTFGVTSSPATASKDTVDILVHGVCGHRAMPNTTKDPIVITVGKFNGGTKHNIIPHKVELGLTVRTKSKETRKRCWSRSNASVAASASPPDCPTSCCPRSNCPCPA